MLSACVQNMHVTQQQNLKNPTPELLSIKCIKVTNLYDFNVYTKMVKMYTVCRFFVAERKH